MSPRGRPEGSYRSAQHEGTPMSPPSAASGLAGAPLINDPGVAKEAMRQQMLLRALWRDARAGVVGGWLAGEPARWRRGLEAYQANAGALAERALAAAYPSVVQIVGGESFAALARAYWHHDAPTCGDIGAWGAGLPAFIAGDAQLAGEPYLADVARLDRAVHEAERARDDDGAPPQLQLLASHDPASLHVRLRAGTAVIVSSHPIVAIWCAHRSDADDRFDAVRAAFAAGVAEPALVHRRGWHADVTVLSPADAAFTAQLLDGASLGAALSAAGERFDFESWLLRSLRLGIVTAVEPDPPRTNA
jgi:hypothetical protein